MIEINPPVIRDYPESLRTCIREDYPDEPGDLPISGGWGYTLEDAVVIEKNDPAVDPDALFDEVGLEYIIVEKRIYYELIVLRQPNDRYAGIRWELIDQEMTETGGRRYDRLRFYVTAHRETDFEALKYAYDRGRFQPDFDEAEHFKMHEELLRRYVATFWFDVSGL